MRLWTFVVLSAAFVGLSAAGAGRPFPPVSSPLLLGVTADGYPITVDRLVRIEKEMPCRFHLVVFFLQWPKPGTDGPFPTESLDAIWNTGRLPCITWEPFFIADGKERAVSIHRILDGSCDRYLFSFAAAAREWRKPLIIRLAHEMNLSRYHWGGPPEAYGPESPGVYRALFRYVRGTFDRVGADNILWAFCPNAESIPNPGFAPFAPWNRAGAYYPGHDVVDLLGMDGYNWGTTQTLEKHGWQSRWRTFRDIFTPLYKELTGLAPDKPVLVFETASAEDGGSKAQWVTGMLETAGEWRLLGVSWFQVDKEIDWRLKVFSPDTAGFRNSAQISAGQQWAVEYLEGRPGSRR